ncbi:MAG: polysaccharide deacetylase family protein, partial [Selenomonadaceae bacterium]|nr:polysaccharide deacetylase family protein [Selenomonadaceae bacterium]
MKNIQTAAMAVCLAGILFSGCGSQKAAAPPPASSVQEETETAQDAAEPPKEEAPAQLPYITATKDFDNLQLGAADIPVYDAYTLAERRANGMTTALPKLTPYREKKVAYLTFDDGPDDVNTPAILEILRQENIKATFYVVGRNALTYPDIAKQIFLEGHAIGNHSYDHDYDRLYASVSQYLEEMEHTDEILHGIIGVRPLVTRAPGGRIGHFTGEYVSALA